MSKARGWLRKIAPSLLAVSLAFVGGCNGKKPASVAPETLTIACYNQMTFDSIYRAPLQAVYPTAKFKIVPLDDPIYYAGDFGNLLKSTFANEKPDLVILNTQVYRYAADQGMLRDLDKMASLHKFDMKPLFEGMLDQARNNDEGRLYGLSPLFRTSALFYNKTLFDRYGVPLPNENMDWDEILRLAGLFVDPSKGDDVVGLHLDWLTEPFGLMSLIAQTEGVRLYDGAAHRLTFDSEAWRAIFSKVLTAYDYGTFKTVPYRTEAVDGVITVDQDEANARDLFGQGKAALTIGDDDLMRRLKKQNAPFEWDVLPGPVRTGDRERGGFASVDSFFAIPADSQHPEEAWNLIASTLSETTGKVYMATEFGLSANKRAWDPNKDPQYESFYRLKPVPAQPDLELKPEISRELYALVNEQVGLAIAHKKTIDEAIAEIQQTGSKLVPAK